MASYICQRCKVRCYTTDEPHLCKDLKSRLARQTKAVAIVRTTILDNIECDPGVADIVALAIVEALAGRDLGVE